jgi:hypothetical protein
MAETGAGRIREKIGNYHVFTNLQSTLSSGTEVAFPADAVGIFSQAVPLSFRFHDSSLAVGAMPHELEIATPASIFDSSSGTDCQCGNQTDTSDNP